MDCYSQSDKWHEANNNKSQKRRNIMLEKKSLKSNNKIAGKTKPHTRNTLTETVLTVSDKEN